MNAVTRAGDLPVFSFCSSRVEQAWIPGERNDDGPPILQRDAHCVSGKLNIHDSLISRQC